MCTGSLILHADGTITRCAEDDEVDCCRGRDERHDGAPKCCLEGFGGCNYCGIQT
jgi:hypothetical protein